MIDAKSILEKAAAEVNEELSKEIVTKVKAKLRDIARAEKVVANLRFELQAIVADASA